MPMPPKPPEISLTGQMQANISGVSHGTDISLIVFGIVCLIGTLGCFALSLWQPWASVGAVAFLVGFGFILYVWRQGAAARTQAEASPAQFTWKSGVNEVAVSIPLDSQNYVAKKILSGMRSLIQGREPPPTPRGEVRGNPSEQESLKEYSENERSAIEEKWAREVSKHDQVVVEQLESAIKSLESESPDENTRAVLPFEGSNAGMPQVKDAPLSEPKKDE